MPCREQIISRFINLNLTFGPLSCGQVGFRILASVGNLYE
jgi:hypothetical protein